jgi:hypothetical protein
MSLRVRPIGANGRDFSAFLDLPYRLHRGLPNWVPPLRADVQLLFDAAKNPFFEHAEVQSFLAERAGSPGSAGRAVGRLAAIHNRAHNAFQEDRVGFWGFFECENDPEAATALFDAAEAWLAERGLDTLRGPMNFSTNDDCGLLVRGFHRPPLLMMPFNPEYYIDLVEGARFAKAKDLFAWVMSSSMPRMLARSADRARRRYRIETRPLDMRCFEDEVRLIRGIYNSAWEKNWGFVPMTEHEIDHMAKQLKPVIVPAYARIATIKGEVAGFGLGLPDFNEVLARLNGTIGAWGLVKLLWHRRRIRGTRVITLGIKEPYRNQGVDVMLYHDMFVEGFRRGVTYTECSWVLEDNAAMNRVLEHIGAVCDRVYRIYDRPVGAAAGPPAGLPAGLPAGPPAGGSAG